MSVVESVGVSSGRVIVSASVGSMVEKVYEPLSLGSGKAMTVMYSVSVGSDGSSVQTPVGTVAASVPVGSSVVSVEPSDPSSEPSSPLLSPSLSPSSGVQVAEGTSVSVAVGTSVNESVLVGTSVEVSVLLLLLSPGMLETVVLNGAEETE
jgi:hypothetical protein